MQPRPSDEELDHLLSRGSVGAARRDAILQTVLVQAKTERNAARRRRWSLAGLGLTLVAATTMLLLVPRGSHTDAAFRAKGSSAQVEAPRVRLECVGAPLHACPAGSLLVLRASGVRGYISAWAEPINGGERIWYFSAESSSPLLDGIAEPDTVTTRAARIGAEHAPGTYVAEIRLTAKPMTRAELLRAPATSVLASARERLTVVAP